MRRTTLQQALLPTLGAAALVCFAIVTGSARPTRPPRSAPPRSAGGPAGAATDRDADAARTPSGSRPHRERAGRPAGAGDRRQLRGLGRQCDRSIGRLSAYDLSNGRTFPVYHGPADQRLPAVSGGLVVWQDNRNGDWDIYGARLTGNQAGAGVADRDRPRQQTTPAVSGNNVVWQNQTASGWEIVSVNLTGGQPQTLSDAGTTNENAGH